MGKTAEEFSTSTAYSVGDLCLYGGKLYIFTAAHAAGDWDDDDVKLYDKSVEQDLNRVISGYENAKNAAGFVETVVLEATQITGTRYKFVATSAPDPRN